MVQKIIGVGLPKTGTVSLHQACLMLGFKSAHRPEKMLNHYRKTAEWEMGQYDAVFDVNPWAFPNMIDRYPDAAFIYSVRPYEHWMASCEKHFGSNPGVNLVGRIEIFGVGCWDKIAFRETWIRHRAYFVCYAPERYSHARILHFDIESDRWEKLCDFLNVSIPAQQFPHCNQRAK